MKKLNRKLILTKKRILVSVFKVFRNTQLRRRKSTGRDARDVLPKRKESDSFDHYDNKHNNNNNNNNNNRLYLKRVKHLTVVLRH